MTGALAPSGPPVTPEDLFAEILEEIAWGVANQPRTLQELIGPSEVGDPCNRALIHKMMGLPEPEEGPKWQAWVGGCMHTGLQGIFEDWNQRNCPAGDPRFLLEQKVTVGPVGDWLLEGSCDFFDTWTGALWDWKTKSKTQHAAARRNGMGPKYRTQFDSYGLGMENAGHRVTSVGGIFLLRDGKLSETYPLWEPYDRQVALDALARANQLYALGRMLGAENAKEQYPKCDDEYCRICEHEPRSWPPAPPRPVQTTLVGLFDAAN